MQPRLNGSDEPHEAAHLTEHSFDPRRRQDARSEKAAAALAMVVVVSRPAMSGAAVVIVRCEMMIVRRTEHLAQTRRCNARRRSRDHGRRHDDEQRIEHHQRHSADLAPVSHRATGSFSTRKARPNRAGTLARLLSLCGEMKAVSGG